jgi:hypothetical protein
MQENIPSEIDLSNIGSEPRDAKTEQPRITKRRLNILNNRLFALSIFIVFIIVTIFTAHYYYRQSLRINKVTPKQLFAPPPRVLINQQ